MRKLANSCEYGTLTDSLIEDRLVIGIIDNGLRKRLLQEDKLNPDRCIDMYRAAQSTKAKVKTMSGSASGTADEVNAIKQKFKAYRKAHFQKKD